MSELIDTTEMYLRTIFELEEEGIVPLRARIAERLHQSGPTVSQTVARMERDGLVVVQGDRHLELTPEGRTLATRVMRKHRLVERLLVDVIGLDWELVHDEACRWEHVVSEKVEERLLTILESHAESPYGNPIPGLDELGVPATEPQGPAPVSLATLLDDHATGGLQVTLRRLTEEIQKDIETMAVLEQAGLLPGADVAVTPGGLGVQLQVGDNPVCELSLEAAGHLFVDPPA
ncbi:MAG TPA: metal-dependent transcriptional regulator [Candidatus Avipropionibacterium avicola]|uniref:Metal-dependent transcriptional regulator n=1 Tax=Candidatus Avipropionibacterium avicola TaxID=2840701 RepID=A0A9D1GXA3_9ACTN|nr:metal-dependent transcriptional regulator [Candidatus Avipropionibacterium avicola]